MSNDASGVVRVTGTADPAEIAVALAALSALTTQSALPPVPSAYDRWRAGRVAALRASRRP